MQKDLETIHGQPSWRVRSDSIDLAVTRLGGMMAPVTFFWNSNKPVAPYYIAPWAEEDRNPDPPVLRPLRGDFFCLPFGANAGTDGLYTVHGEPASEPWSLEQLREESGSAYMELSQEVRAPECRVVKRLWLRAGEHVVYTQHEITGANGAFPLGHHATLAPPPHGALRISHSEYSFGMTGARPSGPMIDDEYFALPPLAVFERLEEVPTVWSEPPGIDCSRFPRADGFSDILSLFAGRDAHIGWTAATADEAGYVWFTLKDARLLPCTLFWFEERGRRGEPWLGRNRCIGLEEICGFHAIGLPEAGAPNEINRRGTATAVNLTPGQPTSVNTIQGCARVPPGFGHVRDIKLGDGEIRLFGADASEVTVTADPEFVRRGHLQ
jgi:hypothetical protein